MFNVITDNKALAVEIELQNGVKVILATIYCPNGNLSLRTSVPFVTAHLEIFHCTHHPVIPKSDLYFTFCSTLNACVKDHQNNC